MNRLAKSLLIGLLEDESKVIAFYGGGFKPPTKGHFEVVKKLLQDYPEITKLYIVVGSGVRNGITQKESKAIWEIYQPYLSDKIEIVEAQSPLTYISTYIKENPDIKTYVAIGTREGDEDDAKDFIQRKEFFSKSEGNIEVLNIVTAGGVSGTKARKFAGESKEEFFKYLPNEITDEEREQIYNVVSPVLKENQSVQEYFDYPLKIKSFTQHMITQGLNIQPLPKVKFIKDDSKNAKDFFGKTAYYDPNQRLIVLYTMDRHPKDVMRSFAHEMIHHMQNCEGRLDNITTQNTNEGGDLPEIEREAYEKGNMCFRNWTDTLTEGILVEGRYDKISTTVSSQIFNQWKQDFDSKIKKGFFKETYITDNIEFDVVATLKFILNSGSFKVDGGLEETEDGYTIYVDFEIDPESLPEMWSEISMNLKDVIRHEIEHITQSNIETFPSKYIEDDQYMRNLIGAGLLSPSRYFKLKKEIDAQLQGMYFRAKKEKRPFIDVLNTYLNSQKITPEEKEEILDIWRTRAKSLSLPKF